MASGAKTSSVPLTVLHEAEGHAITVELKTGELYRGHLDAAEDTMNLQLSKVALTAVDGKVTRLEHVYLRGSHIRFIVLPELLKHAPVFKKVADFVAAKAKPLNLRRGRGRGRGRGGGGAGAGGAAAGAGAAGGR